MKKSKQNPRGKGPKQPKGKRKNPAVDFSDELSKHITRSMGPMILAQSIPDATLPEIGVLACILPFALKILRTAGQEGIAAAFDKLYAPGDEIIPGLTVGPDPADGTGGSQSDTPEAKQDEKA